MGERGPIAVTGATGRTGRLVVEGLTAAGASVRALSRRPDAIAWASDVTTFDWADRRTHDAAVVGASTLYMATPFSVRPDDAAHLVDRAVVAGITRVVQLSAVGASAMTALPLGEVESVVEASPMVSVILEAQWFMQNFSHPPLATWIAKFDELRACCGDARTATVDARDVAAVAVQSILRADQDLVGRRVVSGPEALTMAQVAEAIGTARRRPVQVGDMAPEDFGRALVGEGIPPPVATILVQLFAQLADPGNAAVSDTVRCLTGRPPRAIRAFVRSAVDHWIPDRPAGVNL